MEKMNFNDTQFGIYMLPVGEGDCFYIQLPCAENTVVRIMIDSGPVAYWHKTLKPFLEGLASNQLHIDLLIITHIDADHIGGALCLFKDERLRSLINSVWYNGLAHIAPKQSIGEANKKRRDVYTKLSSFYHVDIACPDETISAKQALMLTELLRQAGKTCNNPVDGPICAETPCFTLAPGVYIDILLPTRTALNNLYFKFASQVNSICMGTKVVATPESERAFELSLYCTQESIRDSQPIAGNNRDIKEISKWATVEVGPDRSITNATSIAICIRYYGKTILFPGDAISSDLIPALQMWSEETGLPLWFDIIKTPHHGSAHNCLNLLDYIDGTYFLISTNGGKFAHPDKETLAKIVSRPIKGSKQRKLLFNYVNEKYVLFSEKSIQKQYQYQTVLCDEFITFCD